jgi:DoxX-like family
MISTTWKTRAGRAITAVPVLFLLFDGTIKLIGIKPVVDSFTQLGFNPDIATTIGILELVCLAVYLVPRTSLAGAVLMTGYLGGAVAIHLRLGHPLFSHVLFPLYVGALLWSGLLLRNERLRTLLPVTSTAH